MSDRYARWPAAALVEALRGRTVVDAYCDGQGVDDVHLRLDDGTQIWLDADVEDVEVEVEGATPLALGPRGRLLVTVDSARADQAGATPPS